MNFSLEITSKTELSVLPGLKDVYVTMLPGTDYREVARKADELVRSGYNPIPHFPARSIKDLNELTYPTPMVDHAFARNRAIATYKDALASVVA